MVSPGKPETSPTHAATRQSFEQWFDRELAEINATLARLEASLPAPAPAATPPTAKPRTPAKPRSPRQTPKPAVSSSPQSASSPAAESAPSDGAAALPAAATENGAAPQPAAPPLPTGTDLADPKNFGVLPPTHHLEAGDASLDEQRKRLAQDLTFANTVLHTPRVQAAIWREWRVFEKAAHERLRALAGVGVAER